jgi:class 3 adenylate cyclase
MPDLPSGTVTFLFTDIEGSTAHWERDRQAMAAAVERHFPVLREAIAAHGGDAFKPAGTGYVGSPARARFSVQPYLIPRQAWGGSVAAWGGREPRAIVGSYGDAHEHGAQDGVVVSFTDHRVLLAGVTAPARRGRR